MNQPIESRTQGRTPPALVGLLIAAAVLVIPTLYAIFVHAPVEQQMGVVQKIFYFHVPCANAMYLGFGTAAFCSAMYLYKRDERWDAFAVAGAEVGLAFCAAVLISGPLWARKSWGVWWTWDPRLTTTMLAALVFLAYVVLRSFGGGEVEKRFASGLAISGQGGGIHPDMVPALVLSFLLMTALAVSFIWLRARAERVRQQIAALELDAASSGLLEENA
jgi:heme exporter protein C